MGRCPDARGDAAEDACAPRPRRLAGDLAIAGARFFGFVIGGALPQALAANWLAGAWDQNAGLYAEYARDGVS